MATLIPLNHGKFIPNVNKTARVSVEEILESLTIYTRFDKHDTIDRSNEVRLDGQSTGLTVYNFHAKICKNLFSEVHLNKEVELSAEVIKLVR